MVDMNRLLLMNYDLYKEMMLFDPQSGHYDVVERNDSLTQMPLHGSFIEVDGWVTMFYKHKDRLYFVGKGQTYDLHDPKCTVTFERIDTHNRFQVHVSGQDVYSHFYRSYQYDPLNMADITFDEDEEENQDFFLFVSQVMQDPARQQRIYSGTNK